jgi:lipid-A-disaccharide synthase
MLSAGEISGDLQASLVVKKLFELQPKIYLYGLGSTRCQKAGMEVLVDITHLNTVGIIEPIRYLPSYWKAFSKAKRLLKETHPDVLFLVDNQGFNLALAKVAKKLAVPTVYYFTPQVWLWAHWNAPRVARLITHLVCVYKEEAKLYKKVGGQCSFVGHPILEMPRAELSKLKEELNVHHQKPVIALFPGSRWQELKNLLPILINSAVLLKKDFPEALFLISAVSPKFEEVIRKEIKGREYIKLFNNKASEILQVADLLITSSGSATLEAAYFSLPMIIIYKISSLSFLIGKRLVRYPYVGLPNILAGKEIVPELLQREVTPGDIRKKAGEILGNKERLAKIKKALGEVINNLGEKGAVEKTAKLLLKVAQEEKAKVKSGR